MKMRQADPTQPAELLRKKRNVLRRGDRMLTASGILLAAVSALFPWYVFLNQEKFGIRTTSFEHMRDLPPTAPRNVMSVSPLAMIDSTEDEPVLPPEPTDAVTTATVSSLGEEEQNGSARPDQPFPGKSGFRLLHVSNGRALIEDRSGMYMVRIGSILPDNSKLATIEQRDGRWVIITSSGQVYEDAAAARP
jgi:hypothetical protein